MKANVGDRLLVESHSSEQHRQEGEIIEVQGREGQPPFLVRWTDGHESLCYPGAGRAGAPADDGLAT